MVSGTGGTRPGAPEPVGGHDLTVGRLFPAAPAAAFAAFVDMYGPDRPDWIVESQLDLRAGGRWTVVFRPPGLAEFREIRTLSVVDPPRRLAYDMTTVFDGAPGFDTTVDLTFEPEDGQTRLSLVQRGFHDAATRDDFADGWSGVLDILAHRIAGR